jgi:hypothetical protein
MDTHIKFFSHILSAEDLKTRIRDVISTINRYMLASAWEELEFRLDVLRATQSAHTEVC